MIEIERISLKIAQSIKDANPEETKSVEVMAFSISILINFFSVLTASMIIGYLFGKLEDTLESFFSLFILRSFSGGLHAKTLVGCFAASTIIFISSPFIPINENNIIILNIISLILVLMFAPNSNERNNIPENWHPFLKVISCIIVISNFFIGSAVIAVTFFIQSLLLIKIRR